MLTIPLKTKPIIIPKTPYGVISQCLFNSRVALSNPPLLKPLKMQKMLKLIMQGWYVAALKVVPLTTNPWAMDF